MSTPIVFDCRPENYDSLSREEKARYASAEDVEEQVATISGHIFIGCDISGCENVAVASTHAEVEETIRDFHRDKEDAKACFAGALNNIAKYRGKIDEVYRRGGEEWDNLLCDIKLYYCARAVLLKRPIPILGNVPRDRVLPAGAGKWTDFNELPKCDTLPDNVGVVNENPRRHPDPDVVSATIVEEEEDEDSNDEMDKFEAAEWDRNNPYDEYD